MKITKEKLERKDQRENLIDFIFCSKCVTFISIENKNVGGEIECVNCHIDKFIKK